MKLIKRLINVVKSLRTKPIKVIELTPEPKGEGVHTLLMKLINNKGTFALLTWDNENGQLYLSPVQSQVTDEVNNLFKERSHMEPWTMDEVMHILKDLKCKNLTVTLERRDFI